MTSDVDAQRPHGQLDPGSGLQRGYKIKVTTALAVVGFSGGMPQPSRNGTKVSVDQQRALKNHKMLTPKKARARNLAMGYGLWPGR
jgi:hypothetical protein